MPKNLNITIPLGSAIDSAACLVTGHQWGPWELESADAVIMTRTCKRCGRQDHADFPKPKG